MKMERLSQDKIRVFLTFDDLMERGIQKEDMWNVLPKVRDLFMEMMDQAYAELGFDANGPLAVEVFTLPAQGMVVIVTRGSSGSSADAPAGDDDTDILDDDKEVFEMEVTLEECDVISYAFGDFEHVLSASRLLCQYVPHGGKLYVYKGKYILQIDPAELRHDIDVNAAVAILSEYGDAASVTEAVLEEYGKLVISDDAVSVLCARFG